MDISVSRQRCIIMIHRSVDGRQRMSNFEEHALSNKLLETLAPAKNAAKAKDSTPRLVI